MPYDFPGNIRELKNIIEYACILCSGGVLLPEHFPEHLAGSYENVPATKETTVSAATLNDMEEQCIRDALKRNAFRRLETAKDLGIGKTTLWRKIKKYGIEIPE